MFLAKTLVDRLIHIISWAHFFPLPFEPVLQLFLKSATKNSALSTHKSAPAATLKGNGPKMRFGHNFWLEQWARGKSKKILGLPNKQLYNVALEACELIAFQMYRLTIKVFTCVFYSWGCLVRKYLSILSISSILNFKVFTCVRFSIPEDDLYVSLACRRIC